MHSMPLEDPGASQEKAVTMLGINLEQIFTTDLTFVHDVENALSEDPFPSTTELAEGQSVRTDEFIQRFLVGLLVEAAQKLFFGANDVAIKIELERGKNGPSTLRKIAFDRLCNEFQKLQFDNKSDRLKRAYMEFIRRPGDIERRTAKITRNVSSGVTQTVEA